MYEGKFVSGASPVVPKTHSQIPKKSCINGVWESPALLLKERDPLALLLLEVHVLI
uniref:Uncharacterized protein n=1 Tax=Setaria italica TaxID=4555 RepID=K3XTQ3_SETIT